jgi:ribosomal-protein-alanine N-acetyltransferase
VRARAEEPLRGPTIPLLRTPRLVLTIPGVESAPRLVAYYRRNRARLEPVSPPFDDAFFTHGSWEARLAQARIEFIAETAIRLVAFPAEDPARGPVIAALNFTQCHRGPLQACTLGYSIDGEHEGRGLMREAIEAGLRYVFDDLRFHRVCANHLPTNERSGALLRRLGFVVEGYARDYLFIGGRWRDHVLTSKTNPADLAPARPEAPPPAGERR